MFSGIVEDAIKVVGLRKEGTNLHITMSCPFSDELRIDQSIAHNGVCLTVVALPGDGTYTVTAIQETLDRSNLGLLKEGDLVNVERSMLMNGRLDGHIVQGHVDTTAVCESVETEDGSWRYRFRYCLTVNGVSLTVCDSEKDSFSVAIIPYTHDHTNFSRIEKGTKVNLEFDIIGKYLARLAELS